MLQTMTTESLRDKIGEELHNLTWRLKAVSHCFRKSPPVTGIFEPHVLTVTADIGFYCR